MKECFLNERHQFLRYSLAFVICGVALLAMPPTRALAIGLHTETIAVQENTVVISGKVNGATWSLDSDGLLTIVGSTSIPNYDQNSTYAPWHEYGSQVKKIVLSSGIMSVGDHAFYDCVNLKEIDLGNSVKSIGKYAFNACLDSLYLPASVTSIDDTANLVTREGTQVDEKNEAFSNDQCGVLFDKAKTRLVRAPLELSGAYTVPDSVTSIAGKAFYNCEMLTELSLGNSVTDVNSNATIRNCKKLEILTIGDEFQDCATLTNLLDANAHLDSLRIINLGSGYTNLTVYQPKVDFSGLPALQEVNISENNDTFCSVDGVMFSKDKSRLYAFPTGRTGTYQIPEGTKQIYNKAFSNGHLSEAVIPESVTYIGGNAFGGCVNLQEIELPDSIDVIETAVFASSAALQHITLPAHLQTIGKSAFDGCSNLTEIVFPKALENIGDYAFNGCTNLQSVKFDGGYPEKAISATAFSGVTTICQYPKDYLTWSEDKLIDYGGTLTWQPYSSGTLDDATHTYTLPGTNITIGYTINKSTETAKIDVCNKDAVGVAEIPDEIDGYTVTEIRDSAFESCTGITAFIIPDTVEILGEAVCKDCTSLTSVTLSQKIEKIKDYAFANCPITEIVFPENLNSIGAYAFKKIKVEDLKIPQSVTQIGEYAFASSGVHDVVLPDGLTIIPTGLFNETRELRHVTFPQRLTTIESKAFYGCYEIYSLVLPEGVVEIGDSAFVGAGSNPYYGSHMYSVSFPKTLKKIGDKAFNNCKGLQEITIPDSVTYIGEYAFGYCYSLSSAILPGKLETLGDRAFIQCKSLKSVTFRWNAPQIGEKAFSTDKTTCYYPDNNPDWTASIMQNYDGTLTWIGKSMTKPTVEGDPIDVGVNNQTGGTESGDTASVTPPEKGWTAGKNTFKVSSGSPCIVVVSNDGGQTYTKLEAIANDDGSYTFTAEDMTEDTTLTVLKKGDINGDGAVKNSDVLLGSAALLGKQTLTELQKMAADVSGDGDFTNADITALMASILGKGSMSW